MVVGASPTTALLTHKRFTYHHPAWRRAAPRFKAAQAPDPSVMFSQLEEEKEETMVSLGADDVEVENISGLETGLGNEFAVVDKPQDGSPLREVSEGDALVESIVNRQATVMDDAVQLRDKPFILTAGIVFGALVLFLGLGRLPAMFWLITASAATDDGFKSELNEMFQGKKQLGNASDTIKQTLLILVGVCLVSLAGEASLGFIKPMIVKT